MKRFLHILLASGALSANAATYYVSPTGNDSNSGTSQAQAWRTIARVQQVAGSLQAGDQVLFQRGGRYNGQLTINSSGSQSNPIVVGAYGSGAPPEISGSITVSGWIPWQGNIWRAPVSQAVKHVYIANDLQTLARFPNQGWARTTSATTSSLNSAAINQGSGYWNGAELVLRSSNWSYETATVNSSGNGSLSYSSIWFHPGSYDWGFFLRNKLSELDSPGEWFHDAAAGMLYFWPPNNGDPNSMPVEASVFEYGVTNGWQRNNIRVQDIALRRQWGAGVYNHGGSRMTVTGCVFEHCRTSVRSYGSNGTYSNNTVSHTYASGMIIMDSNSLIEGNQMSDIAMYPGLGESGWGYFGIYLQGNGCTIRGNRIERIGYTGIFFEGNPLVERNYISNSLELLNDGGGIYFDSSNGGIVQDNVVLSTGYNVESVGTNYPGRIPMAHGIFFGMATIQNFIVRRNTVAHCATDGIHVDHTLNSSGIQVRDNVSYNNARAQLMISDNSNGSTVGASPPYYQANYNGQFSGNVLYAASPTQRCMEIFYFYGAPVDFGTYTNNRYFHPYQELSIVLHMINPGSQTHLTLERWQQQYGEDAGSTRSPHRQDLFDVTQVHGTNMVPNGTFDYNTNSWSGWPSAGQITHDANALDNGALRVVYGSNSGSSEYFLRHNTTATALQNGQYYRLKFSIASNMHGKCRVEVRAQSQSTGNNPVFRRTVPFSSERRDMSMVFQSNTNEPVQTFFINHHTESTYWIDNVELVRVSVVAVDPLDRHVLVFNDTDQEQEYVIPGCWRDVTGALHTGGITLAPYTSTVLAKEPDDLCAITTGVDEAPTADGERGAPYPNPIAAGGLLMFAAPMAQAAEARFFDNQGRLVHGSSLGAGSQSMTLPSSLAPGGYALVISGDRYMRQHRIVVE
jgi:hypothetical protein